jgi:predicted nucleotidyltransferase
MQIRSDSKIAGLPALQIRDGLRRLGTARIASIDYLARCFRFSIIKTTRLVKDLVDNGLLEPVNDGPVNERRYRLTMEGGTLLLASAAPPISRATADRKLGEFIERVKVVNEDKGYLYRVRRVVVFGSYLSDALKIGDIDLAVELEPRIKDRELLLTLIQQKAEQAAQSGRQFASYLEQLVWPQREVLLKLKSRSRAISLHSTDDAVLQTATSREIFNSDEATCLGFPVSD